MFQKIISNCLRFCIVCYKIVFSVSNGRQCRFEPTCSCYAYQILKTEHIIKALWFILKRLYKCSPFSMYQNNWYYDPIPSDENDNKKDSQQ
jgi:putative membrane protein insertion efficiency factor